MYNGTVSDSNGTYAVSVQACNNASTAQAHFDSLRTRFMGKGTLRCSRTSQRGQGLTRVPGEGRPWNTAAHRSCLTTAWSLPAALSGKRPSNRVCGSTCGTICTNVPLTVVAWAVHGARDECEHAQPNAAGNAAAHGLDGAISAILSPSHAIRHHPLFVCLICAQGSRSVLSCKAKLPCAAARRHCRAFAMWLHRRRKTEPMSNNYKKR